MDEIISQLAKLDLDKQVSDDSLDSICESLNKLSLAPNTQVKSEEITQVVQIVSKLPLTPEQVKKLDNIGLVISNLMRKIKCYEFPDAYKIPKCVF